MNIVFVGPFGLQPKGTVSVRALPLARALVERGHAVTLLIPPWDDPERAGQRWDDNGVQVVNLPLPPGVPLLFHGLLTWSLVIRVIKLQPDVVHFFKPKAYAGLAHLILVRLQQVGICSSVRLVVDADDWEQAWNERLPYSPLQKRFFAWQETWGLYYADAVTVASRALERLVAAHRPGNESTIFYLPNGCRCEDDGDDTLEPDATNRQQAIRQRWQLGESPTILLYTRFDVFRSSRIVALVKNVAEQLPEARWLLVGQGLYGEDRQLAEQLNQANLQQYAHFAGWPVEDLSAYFQVADVAAFPFDDTLINRTKCSVKLIELLLAGLPTVADAVGQNNDYIQHDVSGILIPAEDDAAFAEALAALLQAPEKRVQLGQAAAQRMCRAFNWTRLSQQAERAYR